MFIGLFWQSCPLFFICWGHICSYIQVTNDLAIYSLGAHPYAFEPHFWPFCPLYLQISQPHSLLTIFDKSIEHCYLFGCSLFISWKHNIVGRYFKHKLMCSNCFRWAYVSGFCNILLERKNYTKPPTNTWKLFKQGSQNLEFQNHIFLLTAPDLKQCVILINIIFRFILPPHFSQKFPLQGLICHSSLTHLTYYFHFQNQRKLL